ncbi:uncharacterized protein FFB14_07424 [Fusarium fujikuroi]|nr:uncharacterized protein FFB14_07424 [Fusarium fujikuroi]
MSMNQSFLWTPLHYAAAAGSLAVVSMLLGHPRVDPNSKNDFGETPLWQAARKYQEAVVRLQAQYDRTGSTLTLRDRNNTAPLMEAAKGGHAGVICLLLDMEAVVPDAVDEHRHTALWYTASMVRGNHQMATRDVQSQYQYIEQRLEICIWNSRSERICRSREGAAYSRGATVDSESLF